MSKIGLVNVYAKGLRRRTRVLLHLVLFAALIAPVPSRAATPTLGSTNTITSSSTSYVKVRLASAAKVSLLGDTDPNPDISVSGGGKLYGIALTQDVANREGANLVAVRVQDTPLCPDPGCPRIGSRLFVLTPGAPSPNPDFTVTLPAGNYILHVLTDGSPVSATLRLHGPSGSTTLTPRLTTRLQLNEWHPDVATPLVQPAFWDGAAQDLGGDGLLGSILWTYHAPIGEAGEYFWCLYQSTPQPPAYLPACPYSDLQMGYDWLVVATIPDTRVFAFAGAPLSGLAGQSVWYVAASPIRAAGGIGFWLTYGN